MAAAIALAIMARRRSRRASPEPPPGSKTSIVVEPSAPPLDFVYVNASGEVRSRLVHDWTFDGYLIEGRDAARGGAPRTFRPDRILSWNKSPTGPLRRVSLNPSAVLQANTTKDAEEVMIDGFDDEATHTLELAAACGGLRVRRSITNKLRYLVAGKRRTRLGTLMEARAAAVIVLDFQGFRTLLAERGVSINAI